MANYGLAGHLRKYYDKNWTFHFKKTLDYFIWSWLKALQWNYIKRNVKKTMYSLGFCVSKCNVIELGKQMGFNWLSRSKPVPHRDKLGAKSDMTSPTEEVREVKWKHVCGGSIGTFYWVQLEREEKFETTKQYKEGLKTLAKVKITEVENIYTLKTLNCWPERLFFIL